MARKVSKNNASSVQEDFSKRIKPNELRRLFNEDELIFLLSEYTIIDSTPQEIVDELRNIVIGQDDALKKLVHVVYYNQMANLLEDMGFNSPKRMNIMLIGPSGCGKTSAVNALKDFVDVPIARYTADSITSAGYVGNDVEDILIRLYNEAKGNLALAERGIICIDEIDKKVMRESRGKDINGEAVQQELLKVLESNQIDLTLPNKQVITFDTSRLTVILSGAFVGLDKIRSKRLTKKSLGFSTEQSNVTIEQSQDYIANDIIEYGFIPEFVGRVVMISEFKKLTTDDIMDIILYGENSPYREKVRFIADCLNIELMISKDFLRSIAEKLANSDTGARALESEMANIFYPIISYGMEHRQDYGICEITASGAYILTYDDVTYIGDYLWYQYIN